MKKNIKKEEESFRKVKSLKQVWSTMKSWIKREKFSLLFQYADFIPPHYKEVRSAQKGDVMGMTLNCIWWWVFCSGGMGSVKYSFFAITPRFNLTWSDSTS